MTRPRSPDSAPNPAGIHRQAGGSRWLWLVIGAAVAARSWLLFGTAYVPGVNGAYYLVQARTLLERGGLGFPDLPFIFHWHAALAWLLAKAGGVAQADAVVWAVKVGDAVLPPLAAWPVFVLVRRWAAARGRGEGVALTAAALACFAWPWFRMVGELQKNSLALVWFAALAVALQGWLGTPTPRRALNVLLCLLLLSLTHIGVLGAALLLLVVVTVVVIVRQPRRRLRSMLPWLASAVLLLVAAGVLVCWGYDSARVHRLVTAFTNPARLFAGDGPMPSPPAGPVGPPGWLPCLGFAVSVIPGLVIAWRRRGQLPAVDLGLVTGCAIAVLAMTGPWFGADKSVRFYLNSLLPALLAGAFAVLHLPSAWWRGCVAGTALLVGVGSAWPMLRPGGSAILSDAALAELQGLAPLIARPDRTLICAEHGVEWWTAWLLHARIAQPSALKAEDWQRYESVYFLEVKSGRQMPYTPGQPRAPGIEQREPDAGDNGPPLRARQGAGRRLRIPVHAEIVHDGPCLRLARVADFPFP